MLGKQKIAKCGKKVIFVRKGRQKHMDRSDPKPPATDGWHSAIRYLFFETNANMQISLVSLEMGRRKVNALNIY